MLLTVNDYMSHLQRATTVELAIILFMKIITAY